MSTSDIINRDDPSRGQHGGSGCVHTSTVTVGKRGSLVFATLVKSFLSTDMVYEHYYIEFFRHFVNLISVYSEIVTTGL